MHIYQTNINEYTAVYEQYKAIGHIYWQAITACLWKMKDNGIYIHL